MRGTLFSLNQKPQPPSTVSSSPKLTLTKAQHHPTTLATVMKAPQHCLSNAGKLKFFQTADPYPKYRCSASTVKVTARAASPPLSSSSCSCTIYGSAFSPGDVHYLVVCDSMGRICVWDILLGSSTSKTINDGDTRSGRDMLQTKGIGSKPILW